jgi:alpha-L-rhamnosidase
MYTPTFTQHGFRFVEVTGLTGVLLEADILSWEMHTDVEEIGEVITPDTLINQIQHNVQWGQKKQSYESSNGLSST